MKICLISRRGQREHHVEVDITKEALTDDNVEGVRWL